MNPGLPNGIWESPGIRAFQSATVSLAVLATAWDLALAVFPGWIAPPVSPALFLAVSVLASERIRLPLQNTMAIALLASATGVASAFLPPAPVASTRGLVVAASVAIVAVPGARALARELRRNASPSRGWELPLVTSALGVPAWELGRAWWSNVPPRSPGAIALEWAMASAGTMVLQAMLTPWWIDKRRVPVAPNPAAAIPWILFVIDALVRNASGTAP